MTQLQSAGWPAVSDDTGTPSAPAGDGTLFNLAFFNAVRDAVNTLLHSATNPTVTPEDIIDEVVTARGSKGSLNSRFAVYCDTDGYLHIGGATTIKAITAGTVSINPASIAANTRGAETFTVTGAAVGDRIIINPPALDTGLAFVGAQVTGADTVTVYLLNYTAAPVDGVAKTWAYVWLDIT